MRNEIRNNENYLKVNPSEEMLLFLFRPPEAAVAGDKEVMCDVIKLSGYVCMCGHIFALNDKLRAKEEIHFQNLM